MLDLKPTWHCGRRIVCYIDEKYWKSIYPDIYGHNQPFEPGLKSPSRRTRQVSWRYACIYTWSKEDCILKYDWHLWFSMKTFHHSRLSQVSPRSQQVSWRYVYEVRKIVDILMRDIESRYIDIYGFQWKLFITAAWAWSRPRRSQQVSWYLSPSPPPPHIKSDQLSYCEQINKHGWGKTPPY